MKPFEKMEGRQYITHGIRDNVPAHLILIMWQMISTLSIEEKDSYQFFNLYTIGSTSETKVQVIEQYQEQPDYHAPIMYIPRESFYTGKVYVIDDGENCVMCLPEER